jgi:glucose-6-phosphate 1-epimerase
LHVTNTGTEDFKFQALLHNYLAVPDASKLTVEGLQEGQTWKDKTEGFKEKTWPGGPLKITKEQDGWVV